MNILLKQTTRIIPARLKRSFRRWLLGQAQSLNGGQLVDIADVATPMAIRVAVGARLPTLIESGQQTLDGLADTCDIPQDRLERLLRYLVARDLVHRDLSSNYSLTRLGRDVLKPGKRVHQIDPREALGRAELSFLYLDDALRTGKPTYERVYGTPFWEEMDLVQDLGASLDAYMEKNSHAIASTISRHYDWSTVDHLVDVGGGRGALLRELLRGQPSMIGTVLDLPRAEADARAAIELDGLASRCSFVAANFFENIPVTGATYLLSNILHDWDDAEAVEILRRTADAAGPTGRVLIVEEVPELGADMRRFTHSDLQMLVLFGGKERSLGEYRMLLRESGLQLRAGVPTGTSYGILVASVE